MKKERYFEAVGRRKTSVARVRVFSNKHSEKTSYILINGKDFKEYFSFEKQRSVVLDPLKALSISGVHVTAQVSGGGLSSQAEAVRLGISRALIIEKTEWRPKLKVLGFLKRDPRMVESKKFGSRKARRPQQWRKR
ncbi:MAG: 30S ribosomal protein S9 [Patescibacteria group bacterium]|nr:30S ribosomal protein S9 [Patescibacteria group bacterium]